MPSPETIAVPAIEVRQSKGQRLYTFAIDGKLVPDFASISRIKRTDSTTLLGYQRPEVYSHIEEIRSYLETPSPMIPNGIVIAFNSSVKFRPAASKRLSTDYSCMGSLRIPLSTNGDPRAGFVVDGQQRLGRHPRGPHPLVPDLRQRVHHRRCAQADRAVHPGQLDQAPAQGAAV